MYRFQKILETFKRAKEGNVIVTAAFAAPVLMGASAYAVNMHALSDSRQEMQNQLDIAVLNIASDFVKGADIDYDAAILEVMVGNGYDEALPHPDVKIQGETISAHVGYDHPMFLGQFLGRPTTYISVTSQARPAYIPRRVEIALVLDNTDSMAVDGKIEALRSAAGALVQGVEESRSRSKIALVPFARYVNVGFNRKDETWLDIPAETKNVRNTPAMICTTETQVENRDGVLVETEVRVCEEVPGMNTTDTVEGVWEGCVGSRGPVNDLLDTATPAYPGLNNVWPMEESGLEKDIWTRCPKVVISSLTEKYDALMEEVNKMDTSDGTYMPTGIMWGIRALSPEPPLTESDGEARQVMVIMTDGKNTTTLRTEQGAEVYDIPVPFIANTWNFTTDPQADSDTLEACELAKDKEIEVYTVAFRLDDMATQNLLEECASSMDHALTADSNDELVEVFAGIKFGLEQSVRLSR